MATATTSSETVRALHRQMTAAIWREVLALKRGHSGTAHLAAAERQAASDRLLHLAKRT